LTRTKTHNNWALEPIGHVPPAAREQAYDDQLNGRGDLPVHSGPNDPSENSAP
jgi:hypothetical protein